MKLKPTCECQIRYVFFRGAELKKVLKRAVKFILSEECNFEGGECTMSELLMKPFNLEIEYEHWRKEWRVSFPVSYKNVIEYEESV